MGSRLREGLLKVVNDIVNVLCTDGDTNEIFRDTAADSLLFRKLFVRGRPGVNRESLGVANAAYR